MIKDIAVYFTIIMLEAIPFLLLGAFVSAIIEEFVSEKTIEKLIPKNKLLGSLVGIFLGLFIPACDCAVIPIALKLKKKKVPTNVLVSFMLASPIINPVVLFSTWFAFTNTESITILGVVLPKLFVFRAVFGVLIAFIVGILVDKLVKEEEVLKENAEDLTCPHCTLHTHNHNEEDVDSHELHCHHCSNHHYEHDHKHDNKEEISFSKRKENILNHFSVEFMGIITYMMIGAFIASVMQATIQISSVVAFTNPYTSSIILMGFAFLLSLCSTSDSFIARTFVNSIPNTSILAFLLVGPMIDVKNTIVLNKGFSKKFVFILISLIFILTFIIVNLFKI